MNNNEENKKVDLNRILYVLKSEAEKLSHADNLTELERAAKKVELNKNIEFIERCIKIGVLKKIDSMSREELEDIALQSLSIITKDINPDTFFTELNSAKDYVEGYEKDLVRKMESISNLEFIIEGPLDVLVDKNGNPRSKFILSPEDKKLVEKQVKMNHKFGNIRLTVKVPHYYFSEEELDGLGYRQLSELGPKICGFTIKHPDDYIFDINKISAETPDQHFKIQSTPETARVLTSRYNRFDYERNKDRLGKMQMIMSEVQKKQKLLTNYTYLKEYVQKLLAGSDFVEEYLTNNKYGTIENQTDKAIYLSDKSDLSDEQMEQILSMLGNKSNENLREMFDSPEKINEYIELINKAKSQQIRNIPYLWLQPLDESEETINTLHQVGGVFDGIHKSFKASCTMLNENDIKALSENGIISKDINGQLITFRIATFRYGKISGYYTDERQQTPEFKEKLNEIIEEYRNDVNTKYPEILAKVELCDNQIQQLQALNEEYSPSPHSKR